MRWGNLTVFGIHEREFIQVIHSKLPDLNSKFKIQNCSINVLSSINAIVGSGNKTGVLAGQEAHQVRHFVCSA